MKNPSVSLPVSKSEGLFLVGNAEFVATLGSPALQDEATAAGGHPGAESEFADAAGPAGLIRAFHGDILLGIWLRTQGPIAFLMEYSRRSIEFLGPFVNALASGQGP